jgi:hypothetical protein
MFRMVSPPIIRSSYHCIYSIWHLCDRDVSHVHDRLQLLSYKCQMLWIQ